MNIRQDTNDEAILEQATRAIRETRVPARPSGDFIDDVVAALEADAGDSRSVESMKKGFRMRSYKNFTSVAASLLIFSVATTWMFTGGGGAGMALADVATELDKIRSVTCKMVVTIDGANPVTLDAMYLEPSRHRTESSRGMVIVYDKSKMITLVPKQKAAFVVDLENAPTNGIAQHWLEDVRNVVRRAVGGSRDDIEKLGERKIDGQTAVGFRLHVQNREMSVWANPASALPIRVEMSNGIMKPKYNTVMTDFRFNEKLDESLFSLEPPDGYAVQESSIDATRPQEKDFVALLRAYVVEQGGGRFPPTLAERELERGVTTAVQRRIDAKFDDWRADAEKRKRVMESEEFQAFMNLSNRVARGLGFLRELPPDADWHYAGKNVKLDTPDRPVFWYQPAGSKSYHVIYADLSVSEVDPAVLTAFPDAQSSP